VSYRFSPQAEADLEAIADYIAEFNPGAAAKLVTGFTRRLELLATQPFSGSAREDVLSDLRHLVVGQYVAFYRVEGRTVVVLRVIHGRRDIAAEDFDISGEEVRS
jgi:toxin ParE1/3/4